jgi:hypothetical protein
MGFSQHPSKHIPLLNSLPPFSNCENAKSWQSDGCEPSRCQKIRINQVESNNQSGVKSLCPTASAYGRSKGAYLCPVELHTYLLLLLLLHHHLRKPGMRRPDEKSDGTDSGPSGTRPRQLRRPLRGSRRNKCRALAARGGVRRTSESCGGRRGGLRPQRVSSWPWR